MTIKPHVLLLLALMAFARAGTASGKLINLKDAPFSAVGDGAADDRAALARALSALEPGDTLLVPPGNYRVVLTSEALRIPASRSGGKAASRNSPSSPPPQAATTASSCTSAAG